MEQKKVVVVGAGFGGVAACQELVKHSEIDLHLIDRRNYHLFQPLLYQVAMAGLNPGDIAVPIRKIFSRAKNTHIYMAEVDDVDIVNNRIQFDGGWFNYDYLILACGAKHFYFGNDNWEEFAPGLKNIEQATEIRRRILTAFELAEKAEDPKLQEEYLTFVVVGGGPTGVELAGAIAEMAKTTLKQDYQKADLSKTKVILVEAGQRVLSGFPTVLSTKAKKNLKEMGVDVLTDCRASDLTKTGLKIGDARIECRTIIWAAGVKPSKLTEKVSSPRDPQGRLIVEDDLSLPRYDNVFVVGDQASFKNDKGEYLPGIAPVAIQEGAFAARQILADIKKKKRNRFKYFDKGIMATVGRSKAVVSTGGINFGGFSAWLVWVFIHIVYLMRFKNKFFVFMQWAWSYFRFGRGARLIVHKNWRFYSGEKISYD